MLKVSLYQSVLGFKKESEISQFEFYNGSYHDFEIYGLNVNEGNIAND